MGEKENSNESDKRLLSVKIITGPNGRMANDRKKMVKCLFKP